MTTRMCSTSPFIDTMAGISTQLGKRVGSTRVVKTTVSVCESAGPRFIARALNDSRSNVNIPWPGKGMGDGEYLHAFQRVVMPIARAFDPELVISKFKSGWTSVLNDMVSSVSAGFDAARGDTLGGCDVTPEGYAHMTHMLSSLADGKVVVALEVCMLLRLSDAFVLIA
jgi:acetoin utilization deacetylase AcuC-like enzyme